MITERWEELGGQPHETEPLPDGHTRGCGSTTVCNHPDGHQCPWLDDDIAGRAIPCGCTHGKRASKGNADD